jgi:outer membrane lipoprotein-sorting protein
MPVTERKTMDMNKRGLSAFVALILAVGLSGQEKTAAEIINLATESLNPATSYGRMRMTITTSSGSDRTFVSESWSTNKGEKTLIRYLEPGRVKDQAVLMLNNADDIWMYFPRTQRIRKLATHAKKQKMQGSDFSYEDMGGGDIFLTDFESCRLADERMEARDCYKLELTRKPESDVSYSRLVLWICKDDYVPLVIDYYNDKDPGLWDKRMIASNIKDVDGIPTATRIVMQNKVDNTQTEMEILEIRYNLELPDSLFTERGLKR